MLNKKISSYISCILAAAMLTTACGTGTAVQDGQAAPQDIQGAVQDGQVIGQAEAGQNAADTQGDGTVNPTDEYAVTAADANTGSAITAEQEKLPPLNIIDDKYRTTYEIFVYSFYDSDGDGIGDLNGVLQKLDYVNDGDDTTDIDLGCNEIWLMPINPSPTYHKYDVTDYKEIDPEYGTMTDFENLLKECHARDVNLIIDLVLNHTSKDHPWFIEAKEYLKDHPELTALYKGDAQTPEEGATQEDVIAELKEECPYLYYYNFSTEMLSGYEKLGGTNWYYEARFWSGMPDLNLDNEMVKEEISDITKFWLDKGVDGFRLDAVTSYYTNNNEKNVEFMTWLNDTVKSQNADAYMVGEAWTALSTYSSYYASGIDSFFDFEFSGSEGAIASVARGKKSPLVFAKALLDAEKEFESYNEDYIDAPFYTNHDMARSAGYYVGKGSAEKTKLAGALNLLMGGNAFVYYGEELGMKGSGKDENKRAPMQWTNEVETADAAEGTDASAGAAAVNGDSKVAILLDSTGMCNGPKDMETIKMIYPGLDKQYSDSNSIYNYYKKAIRLRNTYPVIARGKTQPIEALSEDKLGAFVKYFDSEDTIVFDENGENVAGDGTSKAVLGAYEDQTYGDSALLFFVNNSEETKTVDLTKWSGTGDDPELSYDLEAGEGKASLENSILTIPSYGIAVIR